MAHPFAADLSLSLSNHRGYRDDPQPNASIPVHGDVVVEESGTWPHCAQGKKNHPSGFVDFFGAAPISETGMKAPVPPATSYVNCDSTSSSESHSAKLLLFYAGSVRVFDNVTADQAQVILSLAGSGYTSKQTVNLLGATNSTYKSPVIPFIEPSLPCGPQAQDPLRKVGQNMQEKAGTAAHLSIGERLQVSEYGQPQDLLVPCQAMVPKALPLARKASLTRFLERRKERMRLMNAPYKGKGSCWDMLQEEVDLLSPSNYSMSPNGLWGSPGMKKRGCDYRFVDGNSSCGLDVEDRNWLTAFENSKQVSESESAI